MYEVQSIVRFCPSHRVEPQVQLLQVWIMFQPLQFFQTFYVVIISSSVLRFQYNRICNEKLNEVLIKWTN